MATNLLTPETYAGNDIQSATYRSFFPNEDHVFDNPPYRAVMSERPEAFPVHNQGQPLGKRLTLHIEVATLTKANIEKLKKWFDPANGEQYLVATDGDSVTRRILCFPESLHWEGTNLAVVSLSAPVGLWENVTATEATEEGIVASGQTFTVTNPGTAAVRPAFTIKPQSNKSNADAPIRRRYATVVNRSPEFLSDPVGDGYPVDIVNDGFDTDAENTAGQIQADLDDLRVWLNAEEIHRWPDPAGDNPTTKVWCNLQLRARRTFTLGAAMASASVPAAGSTFEVTVGESLAGWPWETAIAVGTELIRVSRLDDTTFEVVERGARGTTAAAHSAAATCYWAEHLHLVITYDHTAAVDPDPPDSRKPLLDLSTSDNGVHEWPGPFFNAEDLRSRAWQRSLQALSSNMDDYVRLYDSAGLMLFEDALPVPGKPNYNNASIRCPVPVDAAAAAVELDMDVENNLLLQCYLVDLDGNESRLFARTPSDASDVQFEPAAEAVEVRLHGRIGSVTGYVPATFEDLAVVNHTTSSGGQGIRFVLNTTTRIVGFVLFLNEDTPSTKDVRTLFRLQSGGIDMVTPPVIPNADLGTPAKAHLVMLTEPINLPGGTYYLLPQQNDTSQDGLIYRTGSSFRATATIFATDASGNSIQDVSPAVLIITDETAAQSDAAKETGDTIEVDNVKLTYASEYEPLCLLGAEEACYLYDFRLKNDGTGDYLDIRYPGLMSAGVGTLTIDCEARTVTDDETGEEVPFAVVEASNPEEWLTAVPGANTLRYTEVGVVDVDIEHSLRGKWL
jgi:hypothetical protein